MRNDPVVPRHGGAALRSCHGWKALAVLLASVATVPALAKYGPKAGGDYLQVVRAYADAMVAQGRDVYGAEHSPLFAEALDRRSMRMLEGDALDEVAGIERGEWGIRPTDRMLTGGNPQHCLNLYQVLYALAEVTGERRYAAEADRSLAHFFEHCQSPATGLFCWGEHAGWDFRTEQRIEKRAGNIHEFYRPWVLWEQSWRLAPGACRRFALGLWEHQIGDQEAGDYSRHAAIDAHGPDTEAPYARHGGFYIETWATAYEKTGEEVFLEAIESVLDGLERARRHGGGMLVGGRKQKGSRRAYDVSLAVSLGNAAAKVCKGDSPIFPAGKSGQSPSCSSAAKVARPLAEKMREVAATNDAVFAQAQANAGGAGNLWSNAYGGGPPANRANTCMLRYRQVGGDVYRRVVLETAQRYRSHEVDLSDPVWPGTMGSVVLLMLNAHELTGEAAYLEAADRIARRGVELFLGDGCPLPRASHVHDHYEAVTNGDTLMMALVRLWQMQHRPAAKLDLVFTDR